MKSLTHDELEDLFAREFEEPFPELVFEPGTMELDLSKCPAVPIRAICPLPPHGTPAVKISIRVDARTLTAIKDKAAQTCVPYQTLINRQLRAAVKDWGYV